MKYYYKNFVNYSTKNNDDDKEPSETELNLDDPSFTYFDPEANNRVMMSIELLDNEYQDQHRISIPLLIDLRTEVKQTDILVLHFAYFILKFIW